MGIDKRRDPRYTLAMMSAGNPANNEAEAAMVTTGKVVGIDYTILDGNAWIGDVDGYDMDASLDTLARETREALRREYPGAVVNVSRSRDGGAARECLVIVEDDGCEMAAEPDEVENVNAVAGDVWLDGFWYVAKSDE